jgi:hypothetical protein
MKRRSFFQTIAAVAGFNLLSRFSVTAEIPATDTWQLNELFAEATHNIEPLLQKKHLVANAYWGKIKQTGTWPSPHGKPIPVSYAKPKHC